MTSGGDAAKACEATRAINIVRNGAAPQHVPCRVKFSIAVGGLPLCRREIQHPLLEFADSSRPNSAQFVWRAACTWAAHATPDAFFSPAVRRPTRFADLDRSCGAIPTTAPSPGPDRNRPAFNGRAFATRSCSPPDRAPPRSTLARSRRTLNAFDEVPDSSWFVDLRRTSDAHSPPRAFSAEEIAHGFVRGASGPCRSPSSKARRSARRPAWWPSTPPARGTCSSWIRPAARSQHFDGGGGLAAGVAAGWLVPAEENRRATSEDLILSPKAKTKNEWSEDIPLTAKMLADLIARTPREPTARSVCA